MSRFYSEEITGAYLYLCTELGQCVDIMIGEDLPDEEWKCLIVRAFEFGGMSDLDYEKLEKSLGYHMSKGVDLDGGLGPLKELPPFDEWVEELDL